MHDEIYAQIAKTYRLIDGHWDALWGAAHTDADREQLKDARDGARDAFFAASATKLEDNHSLVVAIRASLKDANDELDGLIMSMASFSKTIKAITQAVTLAAAVVTLAGV